MTEKEIVEWIWERVEFELARGIRQKRLGPHPMPSHRRVHLRASRAKHIFLAIMVDAPLASLTPDALVALRLANRPPAWPIDYPNDEWGEIEAAIREAPAP